MGEFRHHRAGWKIWLLMVLVVLIACWVTTYKLSLYEHLDTHPPQARFAANSVEETLPKIVPPAPMHSGTSLITLLYSAIFAAVFLRHRVEQTAERTPDDRLIHCKLDSLPLFHRPPPTV